LIREQLALEALRERAQELGFFLLGVAEGAESPDYAQFNQWLDRGYAGAMDYLPRRREAYRHPENVMEGCRSIIMLAMPYSKHPRTIASKGMLEIASTDASDLPAITSKIDGTIAAYAAGARDYHDVIRERQEELLGLLREMFPGTRFRGVVDTAPLLERCFGRLAGLGWQGKNTLLLNKKLGSYFFLSAILSEVHFPTAAKLESDHCGTCRACLDACPTQAFPAPYVLDATRCISYWTIEHRGEIPEAFRSGISDWLFGCDACQTVCPWNRKPEPRIDPELSPDAWSDKIDCLFWLELDQQQFEERFRETPFWRSRLRGMQRNAMIVAANTGRKDAIAAIERLITCGDTMLEQTAKWSLQRLQSHL
jgi:epoxyqueuosine reductase